MSTTEVTSRGWLQGRQRVAEEEEDDGRERLAGGGNGPGPNPMRSEYQPTSR
jgi:hypothetical protein